MMAIIEIRNYSFSYAGSDTPVLSGISLDVGQGDFVLLCGRSGSGKTTLLRNLKREIAPEGDSTGQIIVCGEKALTPIKSAETIGFVMQDPENQIVMDSVWLELAFGLENRAVPPEEIGRRIGEIASFFGISDWFGKPVFELSGGQKQILSLAAVIAMQAEIIILDEPTASLDPIAAGEFLQMLVRVNRELGKTIILSEHRLEEVLACADRVLYLSCGNAAYYGAARDFPEFLYHAARPEEQTFSCALPAATRLSLRYPTKDGCALDVREGRRWLRSAILSCGSQGHKTTADEGGDASSGYGGKIDQNEGATSGGDHRLGSAGMGAGRDRKPDGEGAAAGMGAGRDHRLGSAGMAAGRDRKPDGEGAAAGISKSGGAFALRIKDLWFRYGKDTNFVLKGLETEIGEGTIHTFVGGNGSGKSTLLKLFCGLFPPVRGRVLRASGKRTALLPQDPRTVFVCETLIDDLIEIVGSSSRTKAVSLAAELGLDSLLSRHPYDLSAGELQKAAFAKALLMKPDILLLDEPVRALDVFARQEIANILRVLQRRGVTVVMVTHDLEFAAGISDRCEMIFGGAIISSGSGREFFGNNLFYTTAVNRMSRNIIDGCVLETDLEGVLDIDRAGNTGQHPPNDPKANQESVIEAGGAARSGHDPLNHAKTDTKNVCGCEGKKEDA